MKRRAVSVFVAMVLVLGFGLGTAVPIYAASITTGGSGNWSSTTVNAPWPGGIVPGAGDAVTIANGHIVTVDIPNAQCLALQLGRAGTPNGTGTLAFNTGSQLTIGTTLTVGGNTTGRKGSIVMTNGGTLQIGTTVTIIQTGGDWTPGAGTVEYNGTAGQTLSSTWMTSYNNLTLSGNGAKIIAAGTSVGGNLAISGTAKASINPGSIVPVNTLMLGGVGQVNGTWGATTSPAAHTNDFYFGPTTGMLNVKTWYVDPLGTDDATTHGWGPGSNAFKTIQYAVDNIFPDSIIYVAAGTYNEDVKIKTEGIQLLGANAGKPGCPLADRVTPESIINGMITLQASNLLVDGFEIDSGTTSGIYIKDDSPFVKNNVISGTPTLSGQQSGIKSEHLNDAQILYNNIQSYRYGMNLDGVPSDVASTIEGNCISNTTVDAIVLQGSLSNGHTIKNNNIQNNDGNGISLGQGGDTITGNTIKSNGGSGINILGAVNTYGIHIDSNTIVGNLIGINIDDINGYAQNNRAWFNIISCNTDYGVYRNETDGDHVVSIDNGSEFDATNNWWGCSDGPSGDGPGSGDKVFGNVIYDPWLVLNLTANPPSITANATSTITADMTKNSNNASAGGFIPDGTEIVFTTTQGSIGSPAATTNGIASTLFTSNTIPGTATISAKVPACATCLVQTPVEITAPNIVDPKTVELVNDADGNGVASPGDTLKYTAVINNTGNGAATGVTFTDTPDANTTLVVGSVITSPVVSVSKGNSLGDTWVAVTFGVISANSTATVSFSVTINKPLSVSQIGNQAITTGTNFSDVKSDDPGTPQLGDPTITKLQSIPLGGEVTPVNRLAILTPWLVAIGVLLISGTVLVLSRRRGVNLR